MARKGANVRAGSASRTSQRPTRDSSLSRACPGARGAADPRRCPRRRRRRSGALRSPRQTLGRERERDVEQDVAAGEHSFPDPPERVGALRALHGGLERVRRRPTRSPRPNVGRPRAGKLHAHDVAAGAHPFPDPVERLGALRALRGGLGCARRRPDGFPPKCRSAARGGGGRARRLSRRALLPRPPRACAYAAIAPRGPQTSPRARMSAFDAKPPAAFAVTTSFREKRIFRLILSVGALRQARARRVRGSRFCALM